MRGRFIFILWLIGAFVSTLIGVSAGLDAYNMRINLMGMSHDQALFASIVSGAVVAAIWGFIDTVGSLMAFFVLSFILGRNRKDPPAKPDNSGRDPNTAVGAGKDGDPKGGSASAKPPAN